MPDSVEGVVTLVIAYSNIVLNSIIYMLRYDVVKRSLMKWARETAAKLMNQPPPTTWLYSCIKLYTMTLNDYSWTHLFYTVKQKYTKINMFRYINWKLTFITYNCYAYRLKI